MLTVSVIIPNFNNEKYLNQCIDSVLAQTYPIKEIIIYDDCSTDGSRAILETYRAKDSRIFVLYGEKNIGVSAARDTAIRATTSDYVCMLDADDYFYCNDKIESEMKMVQEFFEQTGKKVVVFSQTIDVDEKGIPFEQPEHVDLQGNERFRILTRAYRNYMPRDYCFPKEHYENCGGYTKGLSLYEDWELNIKLLGYIEFVYSGNFGTAYRHKSGGLSSADYKKQLMAKKTIFKKYKTTLKEKWVFYLLAYGAFVRHRVAGE